VAGSVGASGGRQLGTLRAGPPAREPRVLFEAWESYHLEVERIHDLGDRVVAVVREVARGRASGVEVDGRWGYVITVEEGLIVRIEAYRDAAQALQVGGVGESEIGA
jgi:ketosteroid isomerase-like protein